MSRSMPSADVATARYPSAAIAVPTASRRRSPQRSASSPAGIWDSAIPPV